MMKHLTTVLAIASWANGTTAFAPSSKRLSIPMSSTFQPIQLHNKHTITRRPQTFLQMNYQLPPPPKGPLEDLKSILPTIGTGILVALFFASPLGGAFFAIFNSLFVLALLTPFILFVGFQIWSTLYTFQDTCPSCGQVPVRALKNGEPTVCLNCGAFSRVNESGDGLELCNNPNDIMGGGSGTLFDALFGDSGFGDSMNDYGLDGGGSREEERKKVKRQGTIIDVEVERD